MTPLGVRSGALQDTHALAMYWASAGVPPAFLGMHLATHSGSTSGALEMNWKVLGVCSDALVLR